MASVQGEPQALPSSEAGTRPASSRHLEPSADIQAQPSSSQPLEYPQESDRALGSAVGATAGQDFSQHSHYSTNDEEPRKVLPYAERTMVGPAKYMRQTDHSLMNKVASIRDLTQGSPRHMGRKDSARGALQSDNAFKTEKWREQGALRWPRKASKEVRMKPTQFEKAEEMVPLQRTLANPQANINSEMWCRSLRTKALYIDQIGLHNQNVANAAVAMMFDNQGEGFSGRTQRGPRRRLPKDKEKGIHTKEWIERPVSVGKLALDHMKGSRYQMDLSPRPCVSNSMTSRSHQRLPSPNKGSRTAR